MKTLVRTATSHDFSTLLSIDQSCFPPNIAYSRDELGYYLSRPGARTLLLEENGEIAAFLLLDLNFRRKTATLVTLDVKEEHRRKGYASTLMSEAEGILTASHIQRCNLQVDTENVAALAFYKTLGFSIVRRLENYYPGGRDAWLMTKTLLTDA